MCEEVQVDRVLEVKAYPCAWVARPEVLIYQDNKQTEATIENCERGQIDLYTTHGCVGVQRRRVSRPTPRHHRHAFRTYSIGELGPGARSLTKPLAVIEAANWPWDPSFACDSRRGVSRYTRNQRTDLLGVAVGTAVSAEPV